MAFHINKAEALSYPKASLPTYEGDEQMVELNLMQSWIIWGAAAFFYLYEYILRVSPSVMTDGLMNSFGVTSTDLGILTSFYYYSYTALQIPCGIIVDKLGPRRVIAFSSLLCTIGSLQFAFSDTLFSAQIGRFLMGAGSACAFLSTLKVAADWFSPRKFVVAAGLTSMMGVLGGSFGARPFAVLVNEVGWRQSMTYATLAGLVVTALVWILIKDRKTHHIEYHQETSASVIAGLKIITTNSQSWLIALYGCLMYLPISAFAELWGVPYLMKAYDIDNELASTASIMIFIGMAIGGPTAAWLSNRLQSRYKVMLGSAVGSLVVFSMAIMGVFVPLGVVFILLFVVGLCKGGQILCFTCVKEINPARISGTTVGFTNTVVMMSGVVFQPGLGMLLDFVWDGSVSPTGIRFYSAEAYRIAMFAIPIALLINCLLIKFIKETFPTVSSSKRL